MSFRALVEKSPARETGTKHTRASQMPAVAHLPAMAHRFKAFPPWGKVARVRALANRVTNEGNKPYKNATSFSPHPSCLRDASAIHLPARSIAGPLWLKTVTCGLFLRCFTPPRRAPRGGINRSRTRLSFRALAERSPAEETGTIAHLYPHTCPRWLTAVSRRSDRFRFREILTLRLHLRSE